MPRWVQDPVQVRVWARLQVKGYIRQKGMMETEAETGGRGVARELEKAEVKKST